MLTAVMDLYSNTKMQVRVNGKTSRGFIISTMGVKQGCPVSPLLFGLFIEQLHEHLASSCPHIGVSIVGDDKLKEMLYADDVTLLSYTPCELQQLCNSLHTFSESVGMAVNVSKTKCVTFCHPNSNKAISRQLQISYATQAVETVLEFKYLGLTYHTSKGLKHAPDHMAKSAGKALFPMYQRFQCMGLLSIDTKLRIFQTNVLPIAMYGAQVWGVDHLCCDSEYSIFNLPAQHLVFQFLRHISGCHRSVSRWALLLNFGLDPVQVQVARLCTRCWTQHSNDKAPELSHRILTSDVDLFRNGNDMCWASKFIRCMAYLGLTGGKSVEELRLLPTAEIMALRFDEQCVVEALNHQYQRFIPHQQIDPRLAPSEGANMLKFMNWFYDERCHYLHVSAPDHLLRCLMRVRLDSVMDLRCREHDLARQDRTCLLCGRGNRRFLEDERHVFLECRRFRRIRNLPKWSNLLSGNKSCDMHAFMTQEDQYTLSRYLNAVLKRRAELLTYAKDNPRIDLFDSSDEDDTDL